MFSLTRACLCAGVLLLVLSLWRSEALPPHDRLAADLLAEPLQVATTRPGFETTVNGVTYKINPLFDYTLAGLVVSKHNADTWWDYIHRAWQDELNVTDLCVVWGSNVRDGGYEKMKYSSGQFTCYFETGSDEVWHRFDVNSISNNHLLADKDSVARTLKNVHVGDQVRFSGVLAEYSQGAFKRGTSTVRTDTGNGACETVFVDAIEIMRAGGGPWRVLQWVALGLLAMGIACWVFLPATLRAERW